MTGDAMREVFEAVLPRELIEGFARFFGVVERERVFDVAVTTGVLGYQNQRDHRVPGDHPVELRRFSARADSAHESSWASPRV